MTYVVQSTRSNGDFITDTIYNQFVTNIADHDSRLTTVESGSGYTDIALGSIIMYCRALSTLSAKWHVCDGTSGTPDLRSKFILGSGSTYYQNDRGGATQHDHDLGTTTTKGAHTHSSNFTSNYSNGSTGTYAGGGSTNADSHTHSAILSSGSSGEHYHSQSGWANKSNLPPYVALYYIMRIA